MFSAVVSLKPRVLNSSAAASISRSRVISYATSRRERRGAAAEREAPPRASTCACSSSLAMLTPLKLSPRPGQSVSFMSSWLASKPRQGTQRRSAGEGAPEAEGPAVDVGGQQNGGRIWVPGHATSIPEPPVYGGKADFVTAVTPTGGPPEGFCTCLTRQLRGRELPPAGTASPTFHAR
jgi:hypothetical protein